jgi:transcriptional regulator with XRE-family HTH domain
MQTENLSSTGKEFPVRSAVMESIGARVRKVRLERGLSQAELGKRVGLTQSTIQEFETGDVKRSKKLLEIAAELGVRQEWLLTGKPPVEAGASESRYTEMGKTRPNLNSDATTVTENTHTKTGNTPRKDASDMKMMTLGYEIGSMTDPRQVEQLIELARERLTKLQQALTRDLDRPQKPGKTG